MTNANNTADVYQPVVSDKVGPPPITMRVVVTKQHDYVAGGVPAASRFVETYVLLSVLPEELRERVKTAVQAILTGR